MLRGIDEAFDKHAAKRTKGRARRINGLAWCAQAVMEAAESMREASVGAQPPRDATPTGFEDEHIARYLRECRAALVAARALPAAAQALAGELAARLLLRRLDPADGDRPRFSEFRGGTRIVERDSCRPADG